VPGLLVAPQLLILEMPPCRQVPGGELLCGELPRMAGLYTLGLQSIASNTCDLLSFVHTRGHSTATDMTYCQPICLPPLLHVYVVAAISLYALSYYHAPPASVVVLAAVVPYSADGLVQGHSILPRLAVRVHVPWQLV
jgi:hypothetical protein